MNIIEKVAYDFILSEDIKYPVTLDALKSIIHKRGWRYYSYEDFFGVCDTTTAQGNQLYEYSNLNDGFIVLEDGMPAIVIKDLPYLNKVYATAHEIAHILLHHKAHGPYTTMKSAKLSEEQRITQEAEADKFTLELLAPLPLLYACHISSGEEITKLGLLPQAEATKQAYNLISAPTYEYKIDKTTKQIILKYQDYIDEAIRKRWKKEKSLKKILLLGSLVVGLIASTILLTMAVSLHFNLVQPLPAATPCITATPEPEPEPTQEPESTDTPQVDNTQQANNSAANAPAKKSSNTTVQSSGQSSGQSVQSQQTQPVEQQPAPAAEQPEVQPRQNVQVQAPVGGTVYITNTGDKYHKADCPYLKSCIPISLSEAQRLGYTPCYRCYKQ